MPSCPPVPTYEEIMTNLQDYKEIVALDSFKKYIGKPILQVIDRPNGPVHCVTVLSDNSFEMRFRHLGATGTVDVQKQFLKKLKNRYFYKKPEGDKIKSLAVSSMVHEKKHTTPTNKKAVLHNRAFVGLISSFLGEGKSRKSKKSRKHNKKTRRHNKKTRRHRK